MPDTDTYTSTVDGAAGHARQFDWDDSEDVVTMADVAHDPVPSIVRNLCPERQYNADRTRFRICGLAHHGPERVHEPYPVIYEVHPDWPEPF